eukprot:15016552-Heterocapsa_arctica.AAC.1
MKNVVDESSICEVCNMDWDPRRPVRPGAHSQGVPEAFSREDTATISELLDTKGIAAVALWSVAGKQLLSAGMWPV